MKKYIVLFNIILIFIFTVNGKTNIELQKVQVTDKLIDALVKVESKGDSTKIGKCGELGILQIRQCIIDDVNNIIDKCPKNRPKWSVKDTKNNYKAKIICRKYLEYWGNRYQKETKRKASKEVLCKIWNGGPMYYKKIDKNFLINIKTYWYKVKNELT